MHPPFIAFSPHSRVCGYFKTSLRQALVSVHEALACGEHHFVPSPPLRLSVSTDKALLMVMGPHHQPRSPPECFSSNLHAWLFHKSLKTKLEAESSRERVFLGIRQYGGVHWKWPGSPHPPGTQLPLQQRTQPQHTKPRHMRHRLFYLRV